MKFFLMIMLIVSLTSCTPSVTAEPNLNAELQTGSLPTQYVPTLPDVFRSGSKKVDISECRKGAAYLAQFQENLDSPVECYREKVRFLYQASVIASAMLRFNEYDPDFTEFSDDTDLVKWSIEGENRTGHAFFEKRGNFAYTIVAYIKG